MPLLRRVVPLIVASIILLSYWRFSSSSNPSHHSWDSTTTMGSSNRPLRLAILEADYPQPKTAARIGSYGGVFTALLSSAASSLSPPQDLSTLVSITSHDVVNDPLSYPSLDDVDALLLTGSKHAAFENDEWIQKLVAYTKEAVDGGRVRVVGVCFGHQILGRAMGARVGKSEKGWEVAVTDVELTKEGSKIFELDKLRIHQMHRDIVFDYPEHALPLGSNAMCTNQGMYRPGRYVTVQGHPEFTGEIISEVLVNRHAQGIFPDGVYESGMERAPVAHDGVAVARAFLRFMREG